MSSNPQYLSIEEIIDQIASAKETISSGKLSEQVLSELIDNVKDLSDRLVILRYKAYETTIKGEPSDSPAATEVESPSSTPVEEVPVPDSSNEEEEVAEQEESNSISFRLDFGDDPHTAPKKKKHKQLSGKQEEIPIPDQPLPFNNPNPPKPVSEPEPALESEEIVEDKNQTSLIDQIQATATINDKAAALEDNTLAKKLGMSPIADIKAAIGINQKFLFMNDLFGGEHEEFHQTLDKLNAVNDFNEAKSFLSDGVARKYGWDMEDNSVQDFMVIVKRRFM